MDRIDLALVSAIGVVLAFALGFLFGIGYEQAETRHELNRLKKRYSATAKELREMYSQSLNRLSERYRKAFENNENDWEEFSIGMIDFFEGENDHIKFGD